MALLQHQSRFNIDESVWVWHAEGEGEVAPLYYDLQNDARYAVKEKKRKAEKIPMDTPA